MPLPPPSNDWLLSHPKTYTKPTNYGPRNFKASQQRGLSKIHEQLRSEAQWAKAHENKPIKRWISRLPSSNVQP